MSSLRAHLLIFVLSLCMICSSQTAWSGAVLKPNGANAMPVFTRSITSRTEISGQFARTTMVMVFQNESESDIEADFIYTLPAGAVATYFAYWAGDEKVEAKIVEKKEAAKIYQHLTEYSRDPALVEFTGKNTFRARISPVFANQDLKVEIRYVQVLPSNGDAVTCSIPIGPAGVAQPDPLEFIDATVQIKEDNRICSVSNNYGLPVTRKSGQYKIEIKGKNYRPRKDLTVRIFRKHSPLRTELCTDHDTGHFTLALTPDHSLKNPHVSISSVRVSQIAPARLRSVRAGKAIIISGLYNSGAKACVTLSGESSSGRKVCLVPVDFSAAPCPGIAPKLWASARMADLGSKRANRKTVINLSFKYGLPSRYTSWLAVPKEELERLEYEKIQPRLQSMAKRMAGMVADGKKDSPEYKSLEADYNKLRKPFTSDVDGSLIQELDNQRYDATQHIIELRHAGKPNTTAEALWRSRIQRISEEITLLDPSSRNYDLDKEIAENERYWTFNKCSNLAEKLAQMVADGKSSTNEAKKLQDEYTQLCKQMEDSWKGKIGFLAQRADTLAWDLAEKLVAERHKRKPNKSLIADLQTKIERIAPIATRPYDEILKNSEYNWVRSRRWSEAEAYVNALAQGKTKEANSHLQRYNELSNSVGLQDARENINSTLLEHYYWLSREYYDAVKSGTAKPSEIKRLRNNANRLAKLTGNSLEKSMKEYAVGDAAFDTSNRMYDTARLLSGELERQQPIPGRVGRLRKDTGKIASELNRLGDKNLAKCVDDYNAAADQAISAWLEEQRVKALAESGSAGKQELEKAADARKEAQDNLEANLYYIRSALRGGDPLISVEAPKNALQVIALLPDGEIKTLEWNPANQRWEARFDVPTGTPDGDYVVKIVVMLSDGTRKLTQANYKVDNTPPTGSATAMLTDGAYKSLRLEIKPSEEVARVVALLPWGERVELHQSADTSTYMATIPVSAVLIDGKIEFILTDNAHNRASVFVDMEKQ